MCTREVNDFLIWRSDEYLPMAKAQKESLQAMLEYYVRAQKKISN